MNKYHLIPGILIAMLLAWCIGSCSGYENGKRNYFDGKFGSPPKREGTIYTFKMEIKNPVLIWSEKTQSYRPREIPEYEIIAHASWDRTYSELPNDYVRIHIEDFTKLIDLIKNNKDIVIEEQEAKW